MKACETKVPFFVQIFVVLVVFTLYGRASAFMVSSTATHDCHERFTTQALKRIQNPPGFPAEVREVDEVLADALQFDVGRYGRDFFTMSLIIGARYNDLHGISAQALGSMTPIHNDPERQMEHFLRREKHDGEEGIQAAVDEAEDFIRWMVDRGVGFRDVPDPWATEEVEIYLRFRGATLVEVSRLYFNLGRAIHVVQDSFSHTWRSADGKKIVEVFNWIDSLEGGLNRDRDGQAHLSIMDDCSCICPAFDRMLADTVNASEDFLIAVFEAETVEQRTLNLDEFFDEWMTFEPGCSMGNNYCDQPVLAEIRKDLLVCQEPWSCIGCANSGRGDIVAGIPILILLAGLILLRHRRKAAGILLVMLIGVSAVDAWAAENSEPECQECRECDNPKPASGYYLIARGGAASDEWAAMLEASAMYRGERWGAALELEYNPFISIDRGVEVKHGAFNIVLAGTRHYQITRRLSMRFELRLGASILLFSTPGYDIGTIGLFLGLRAVGLDWRIVKDIYLTVDPIDVAIPVFKVDKFPFFYKQWRTSIGVAWRF